MHAEAMSIARTVAARSGLVDTAERITITA
jgi:hypothetical protein